MRGVRGLDARHVIFPLPVMARLVRATHGNKRDASMGGPDKPGHDDIYI